MPITGEHFWQVTGGSMWSTDFHLCTEGVRLYLVWSCLEDDHHPAAQQAKADYILHRQDCHECTDPERMEVDEEVESDANICE